MFHPLISDIARPERFTNPFDYEPHPLVELATSQLVAHIEEHAEWHAEINRGKMFGVLVVENPEGQLGYLAAFSGNLDGRTLIPFFVPPVCDLLDPNGFFLPEEEAISVINRQIETLENDPEYKALVEKLALSKSTMIERVATLRADYKQSKSERDKRRKEAISAEEIATITRESQFQKGEIKREEARLKAEVDDLTQRVESIKSKISELRTERQSRSNALQNLIFSNFRMLNARGEQRDLIEIFENYNHRTPPAGSGECAGPKLMQYAYSNSLKPIAMGEFWWGESTLGEVRHHLEYYPACRSKCHAILGYMLEGLTIDPPRNTYQASEIESVEKIYEDEWLVAYNKPAGLPTVRGLSHETSLESIAQAEYPSSVDCLIVHRLDMDTSGVVLMTKSAEAHKIVQQQFVDHTIQKRYIALLDGVLEVDKGEIDLPLAPNIEDRPRQKVDYEHGKAARTHFKVLSVESSVTRVALYPHTGRTHQLRVHSAHAEGLNAPMVGDRLYGKSAERLMLHAEQLKLRHPITGRKLTLSAPLPF